MAAGAMALFGVTGEIRRYFAGPSLTAEIGEPRGRVSR